MEANFEKLFRDELHAPNMRPGSLIKGKVMEIQKNWVIVDTQLKTESVLPLEQFKENGSDEITAGDEIELMLESVENGLGRTQVSYGKARFWRQWLELEKAMKENSLVDGFIRNRVKGGFSVYVGGVKCFLPGSLIEIPDGTNPAVFENTEGQFKIVNINRGRYNVVLSHKTDSNKPFDEEKRAYFEDLVKKGTVRGTVKQIMDFGAFIDLPKGEGLVYIADIMWKRINHPSEVLKVGEEYEFKVLNYNKEKNRLSLSLREMQESPWEKLQGKLTPGQEVSGIVTKIDKYGFFVELSPGIVGLVYLTEIDWINKSPNPNKYVVVGDKVNVKVLALDTQKRRISLGYKQCFNNPWVEYAASHKVGEVVTGKITGVYKSDINKSGLFMSITDKLDGFIHASNIDWNATPEEAMEMYSKGDEVTAKVIIIEPQKEKVALSIKKLIANPFMDFIKKHKIKSSVIECTVKAIENRQIVVSIDDDLDAVVTAAEMGGDSMKDPVDLYKVGDKVSAMLWRIDTKKRIIFLSVRAMVAKEEKIAIEEQQKKRVGFLSTLGDILNLKEKDKKASQKDKQETASKEEDKNPNQPESKTEEQTEDKKEDNKEDKSED